MKSKNVFNQFECSTCKAWNDFDMNTTKILTCEVCGSDCESLTTRLRR